MPGALSHFTILEFGDHPAVAVLGMLLADQGADVVKVETREGDPLRGGAEFAVWNRGKRSVAADSEDSAQIARLRALVGRADAVIEGFSRGGNPFGIDADAAAELRADIVHLELPGFGEDDARRGQAADEPLISAAAGVYADRSADGSEGVSYIALPYASVFSAMLAAPALAAALFHRARSGKGQRVSVPLYDAMFAAMGSALVRRRDVPAPPGALSPAIGRFYRCADGRWINLNAGYERSLRVILDVLGFPDWYDALTDYRLLDNLEELEEWRARFAETWLRRPAIEWEELMSDAGAPLTMCRTLQEWMDTPHAWASGAVAAVDDPQFGPMRQVGVQVRMSDSQGGIRAPAPALGQHTKILLEDAP